MTSNQVFQTCMKRAAEVPPLFMWKEADSANLRAFKIMMENFIFYKAENLGQFIAVLKQAKFEDLVQLEVNEFLRLSCRSDFIENSMTVLNQIKTILRAVYDHGYVDKMIIRGNFRNLHLLSSKQELLSQFVQDVFNERPAQFEYVVMYRDVMLLNGVFCGITNL